MKSRTKPNAQILLFFLVVVCVFKLAALATLAELAKNKRQQ